MKNKRRRAYHGSPIEIDAFDEAFLDKGDDQNGLGFYFSTLDTDALTYAYEDRASVVEGLAHSPTLHTVLLAIRNPLPSDFDGEITFAQAREIISLAPKESREEGLEAWGDIGSEDAQKIITRAANVYAGEQTILQGLKHLSNDFYKDHGRYFNRVIEKVLGYDGVIHKLQDGKNHHLIAWFAEQITITARRPADLALQEIQEKERRVESGGPEL